MTIKDHDPHASPSIHLGRAIRSIFGPPVGQKSWNTHLYRTGQSLLGNAKYLSEPRTKSHHITNIAPEVEGARFRNLNNKTILRHIAELGTSKAPRISYKSDHASRCIVPLLTHRSEKICMFTVAIGSNYRTQVAACINSHKIYCERHGYTFAELGTMPAVQERPLPWYKVAMSIQLLNAGYDTLFYIDADCLITNHDFKLESLRDDWLRDSPQTSMLITEDEGGINSGCYILKNTTDAFRLMDSVWLYDADIHHPNWEQEALKRLITDHEEFLQTLHLEPDARRFNSFPHERLDFVKSVQRQNNTWQEGDFICHLSGIRHPYLEKLTAEYSANSK